MKETGEQQDVQVCVAFNWSGYCAYCLQMLTNAQWEQRHAFPTLHVQILTEITHVLAIMALKEMDGHRVLV